MLEQKYIEILQIVDEETSQTKVPISLVSLIKKLPHVPAATVYSRVDQLKAKGLVNKNTYDGRKAVTLTINGIKEIGSVPVKMKYQKCIYQVTIYGKDGVISSELVKSDNIDNVMLTVECPKGTVSVIVKEVNLREI